MGFIEHMPPNICENILPNNLQTSRDDKEIRHFGWGEQNLRIHTVNSFWAATNYETLK